MRLLVLLFAVLMPIVAWMNQQGVFGPTNGEVSDRYPTLVVAAGYAFSIWGLIFLLDIVYGIWQLTGERRRERALTLAAMPAAAGFMLTTLWMPLFSMGFYWACLVVIFGAMACLVVAARHVVRHGEPRRDAIARWALGLHAGWLSMAAFLNFAQVMVAEQVLPTERMLGWSLPLLGVAAATLLAINHALRGLVPYVLATLWALAAVYVKQSGWDLPGSDVMAWGALAVAALLLVQTLMLHRRRSSMGHIEPRHATTH
jgi:hypothetical protein